MDARERRIFITSVLICEIIALIWSTTLIVHLRSCLGVGLHAVLGHLTRGLVHHVFFPPAAGLLFIAIHRARARGVLHYRDGWLYVLLLLLMIIPVGAVLTFNLKIATSNIPSQPFESSAPCDAVESFQKLAAKASEIQKRELRDKWANRDADGIERLQKQLDKDITTYQLAHSPAIAGRTALWWASNIVDACFTILIGLILFITFPLGSAQSFRIDEIGEPMARAVFLCAVWIPARIIMNCIERVPFGGAAVGADIAFAVMALVFVVAMMHSNGLTWNVPLLGIVTANSIFSSILAFNPYAMILANVLSDMSTLILLGIWVIAIMAMCYRYGLVRPAI